MSTSEHTNAILRAAGDVLLQLGSEPPRRVPNTPLNAASLNASVEQYQKYLDTLELEIIRSIAEARRRAELSQSVVPDPQPGAEVMDGTDGLDHDANKNADMGLDKDDLGSGLGQDLGQDLGQGLDSGLDQSLDADLFDINNDGLGLFGDTSPQQTFSMEDNFF